MMPSFRSDLNLDIFVVWW